MTGNRKRLAILAGLVLLPFVGYFATTGLLPRHQRAAAVSTTTTTTESTTTTSEAATTTTSAPPASTTTIAPIPRPGEPVAASNPKDLAAQIVAAEGVVHDGAAPPDAVAKAAHTAQVCYRALVNHPDLQPATFALLPDAVRATAQDNVKAGADLRSMVTQPKPTLPPWRIVAPAPAAELLADYKEAESATGIPWSYLAAIHLVETRMGRIRGTSTAGAQGPMQFMPSTFAAYGNGGDINSNHDSILAAARYLQHNGAPATMASALYNYNHDHRYVEAVTLYAERMRADERAYTGYYGWQVYYVTTAGDVWLPVGYGS